VVVLIEIVRARQHPIGRRAQEQHARVRILEELSRELRGFVLPGNRPALYAVSPTC
jgi:hypothetical protein